MIGWLKCVVRAWGCEHCEKMHRRAQAAESEAAKVVRQNDVTQLWKTVANLRIRERYWRKRVRTWKDRELAARQEPSAAQEKK